MSSPRPSLQFPRAAAILLLAATAPALRADHIQSSQKPENVIGQAQFNVSGIGNPATSANLYQPAGIAVDPTTGKIFIADSFNNRVLRFTSAAAMADGAAAEAVLGQPDYTSDGHAVTPKELYRPAGLAVDSAGTLWVADSKNHRVLRFNNASAKAQFASSADGVLGEPNLSTAAATSPPTAASMNTPSGLAIDAGGTLWVADTLNNRVLRFDQAASKASGANADGVLGAPVFTIDPGPTTQRYGVSRPFGVAIDTTGTLWVADTFNARVLRFDLAAAKANGALADGVLGQSAYDSGIAYSPPTAKTLSSPEGVTVTSDGTLWVADSGNNRVLRFDLAAAKADGAPADVVLGQLDFTSKLASNGRSGMKRPSSTALDSSGTLFVSESSNNRALRFIPKTDPVLPTPSPITAAPPTLSGKKKITTSKSIITVKGAAASAEGIALVEYRAGKGGFHLASGTTSWSFKIALERGKTTIAVRAVSNGQQTATLVLRVLRN